MNDPEFEPHPQPNKRQEDLNEKRDKAHQAKMLLEDKAFQWATLELRKRWFGELMAKKGAEEQLELVSMLKALEAIPQELAVLINDYKLAVLNATHGAGRRTT